MNYVTQSAVSQAINKLEIIFQTQLVIHTRQKFQVTEQGMVVFNQASQIFKSVKETFDRVNKTKEEVSGSLKFVTTKSLGMSFIATTYQKINQNLPKLDIKFRMGGLNLIRTALKQEEAEFAIVVYDHNFSQFASHPLKKGQMHLYYSKDSSPDLINERIFIDDYEGMYVKELNEHLENYPHLKIKAIAGWELVARFVDLKIGVGFFPDYILSNQRYPNIIAHPWQLPPLEYEICAIYNKTSQLSRAACAFLDQFCLG